MKKIILLFLVLLVAGLPAAGFFLYQKEGQVVRSFPPVYSEGEKTVGEYLPDSAAAAWFVKGLGETWPQFVQSGLFRQLKETRSIPLLSSLAPPLGEVGFVEKAKFFFAEEFFLGAFGQDMAIALYPPKSKGGNSVLLVSRTGPFFKIEETLFALYHKHLGAGDFVSQRIGNFSVATLPPDFFGISLHYAVVNHAVILSNSLDLLKESLGIAGGDKIPKLTDSPGYAKSVGASLATTRYGAFLAYDKINLMLGNGSAGPGETQSPLLVSSFSRISLKDGLLINTNYFIQKEKLDLLSQRLAASPSGAAKTIDFIPSDALFYAGSKGMASDFITVLSKEVWRDNPVARIFLSMQIGEVQAEDAAWQEEISVELGAEWGLASLLKSEGTPALQWVFVSEIKNAQKVSELLAKLLAKRSLSVEKRSHKGFQVHRVLGQGDSPSEYLFHENFLIFGTGEEAINKIIDTLAAKEESPSLRNGKIYTSSGISPDNHFLCLLDGRQFSGFARTNLKNLSGSIPPGLGQTESSLAAALNLFGLVGSIASETVVAQDSIKTKTVVGLKGASLPQQKVASSPQAAVPVAATEKAPKTEPPAAAPASPAPTTEAKAPQTTDTMIPAEAPAAPPMPKAEVSPPSPATSEKPKEEEKAAPTEKTAEKSEETEKPATPPLPEEAAKALPPLPEKAKEQGQAAPTEKTAEGPAGEKSPADKESEAKKADGDKPRETPEEKAAQETAQGEATEEAFIYSSTYRGKPLRDPFASLIAIEIAQIAQTVDISNLWKELEKIGPVHLYLYDRARKEDPLLIKKIEEFTDYFKDTKKLENRSDKEVSEKVEAYSEAVAQLLTSFREKHISPLNFSIGSLSLVGIITGAKNNYALVQTSDFKGYTLRKGDIVGTNYGEVVSISPNKVVIEEKYRNYIGKITTETVVFELKKEEGGL